MHFINCNRSTTLNSLIVHYSPVIFVILFMTSFCLELLFDAHHIKINAVIFFNMHYAFIVCAFTHIFQYKHYIRLSLKWKCVSQPSVCSFCLSSAGKIITIEVVVVTVEVLVRVRSRNTNGSEKIQAKLASESMDEGLLW